MRRTINLRAILILVASTACLGVAAHVVHGIRVRRNAGVLLVRADRAETEGKANVAIECLATYLNFQPDDSQVRARFGLLLSKHSRTSRQRHEASVVLERALHADPTRTDLRRALVQSWIDSERFADAKSQLEAMRQADPGDADIPFLLGRCEEGLKNYEQAAAFYAQACELQPDRIENFICRARLLQDTLRATERADGVIKALVEHNPRASAAHLAAARYYSQAHRWNEADPHLQLALSIEPRPESAVYAWAAEVSSARGDHQTALVRLRSGLQHYGEDNALRLTLARLELQRGNRENALEALRPLTESFPTRTDDLVRLCGLLIDLDQVERAAAAIDRLRGNTAPAIISFLRAHFLVKQEVWGQARVLLAESMPALASADWLLQAHLLLGQCHENLGNPDGAWTAYSNALHINRRSIPANVGRAAVSLRMGRLDEAISGYRLIVPDAAELSVPFVRLLILRNLRLPPAGRDWGEADKVMAGLPKHLQDSSDAIIGRAELLSAKDQHAEACALLDAERQRHPEQLRLWLASIELAASHGRTVDATKLLRDADERFSGRMEILLTKVRLANRQSFVDARKELESVESVIDKFGDADHNRLLAALGDAYAQFGETAAAVKFWKRLAARAPKDLTTRMPLFVAAAQAADEPVMRRLLDEVRHIEGEGGSFSAYGDAAILVVRSQRGEKQLLPQARERADAAAAQRPSWSAAALLQAQIADLEGNADTALDRYQRAVDLGERQPAVIRRVVDLLYRKKRYGEAQSVLQKLPAPAVLESGLGRHAVALTLLTSTASDDSRKRAFELARQTVPSDTTDYRDFLWLGQVGVAAELYAEAEKMFRRAAELDPQSPDPWMALITMLIQSDKARASDVAKEARDKLPSDQANFALAPAYEMLGQSDDARKMYEAVLASKPDDSETLGSVAGFYVRAGEWAKAESCLRKLLQLPTASGEHGHAWARRHLAIVLAATGAYPKVREALVLLAENQPPALDDELALAVTLATQPDRRDHAIALLEKVQNQKSLQSRELSVLARLHEAAGNREKALACLAQLVQTDTSDPQPMAYLIELLLKHGFHRSAGDWLAKLEKLKGDPFLVMSLRVKWMDKAGQGDEAVKLITTFAKENPQSLPQSATLLEDIGKAAEAEALYRSFAEHAKPVGILLLARYLGRRHRVDEAISLCEPLWRSVPPEVVADTCLAVFRAAPASEGQFQKVDSWLASAINGNPQSVPLVALRAELLFHARHYHESISGYREVLRRDPNHVVALNLLAWMLALNNGQGSEALVLVERAIELIGPRADLLDTRAMVYLSLRQTEKAVHDLREVVRLSPSAPAYFHLALAYHQANDRERTEEAFRRAREIGISPLVLHPLERRAFNHLVGALSD